VAESALDASSMALSFFNASRESEKLFTNAANDIFFLWIKNAYFATN